MKIRKNNHNKPETSRNVNWYISKTRIKRVSKLMWPEYKHFITYEEFFNMFECSRNVYNDLVEHRGITQGTKRFLQIRRNSIKLSYGLSVKPIPCMATYATGYPRCIKPLIKWLHSGNNEHKKAAIAALNVSKLSSALDLKLDKSSLSTIIRNIHRDESFYDTLSLFKKRLPKALDDLGIKRNVNPNTIVKGCTSLSEEDLKDHDGIPPKDIKSLFRGVMSKGPNSKFIKHYNLPDFTDKPNVGKTALMAAPLDAFAILNDKKLSQIFPKICKLMHISDIWTYIQELSKLIHKNKGCCTSRLTIVNQPDNKGRIIAMGDYFSQIVLFQIEKYLIKYVESKINCSFAMNQNLGVERVREFTISGNPYSLDGTAFTDRFPKELQQAVLEELFGKTFAKLVIELMTSREFYVDEKLSVRYEVGQPMGLHCSFHLANITHCLVAICCKEYANIHGRTGQLAICGDDIVINGENLSKSYIDFMKNMKMDFNESKGFESDISKNIRIAEFCKSIFVNGNKVSTHNLRLADKLRKDIYYIQQYVGYSTYDFTNVILTIMLASPKSKLRKRANETIVLLALIYSNGMVDKYTKNLIYLHLNFCGENFRQVINDLLDSSQINQFIRIRYAIIYGLVEMKEREFANSLDSYTYNELGRVQYKYEEIRRVPNWKVTTTGNNGEIFQPFEFVYQIRNEKAVPYDDLYGVEGFVYDAKYHANKEALKSSLFTGGLTVSNTILEWCSDKDSETLNKILFRLTLSFINITNELYCYEFDSTDQLIKYIRHNMVSHFQFLKDKFAKKPGGTSTIAAVIYDDDY